MMRKITLLLPPVLAAPEGKPAFCARCGSPYLARHGTLRRPLSDTAVSSVSVQRYRCSRCGSTFRHYPTGVGRARRSDRLVVLAALLRWLGLSCTATAQVLGVAEAHISQATVWRAVRAVGLPESCQPRRRIRVQFLAPGECPGDPGEDLLLRFIEKPGTGEKMGVEVWDYGDETFPAELHDFVRASSAEVIIVPVAMLVGAS